MVRKQPSQFSVFQVILLIIFMISLSACLFSGKLEYMVAFFAIGFMVLIMYFIKWVINHQPSKFPGFVKNIIIIVFIVGFLVCLYLGEFKLMFVILMVGFMVLIILKLDLGHEPSNATLTCKNGHSCRVWVNLNGWHDRDVGESRIIYNIDGHDIERYSIVDPECCPECGAEWLVPNKHNGRKR